MLIRLTPAQASAFRAEISEIADLANRRQIKEAAVNRFAHAAMKDGGVEPDTVVQFGLAEDKEGAYLALVLKEAARPANGGAENG